MEIYTASDSCRPKKKLGGGGRSWKQQHRLQIKLEDAQIKHMWASKHRHDLANSWEKWKCREKHECSGSNVKYADRALFVKPPWNRAMKLTNNGKQAATSKLPDELLWHSELAGRAIVNVLNDLWALAFNPDFIHAADHQGNV